jgi:hypothetical protein
VPPLIDRGHGHPSACHFAEIVKPLTMAESPTEEPAATSGT